MRIVSDGSLLTLAGDFDVRSTREVRAALHSLLATTDGDVVVDMTEVHTVDLTALRVLAAATCHATFGGRQITLRGCTPAVRRMLHKTHLIRVVEVERTSVNA